MGSSEVAVWKNDAAASKGEPTLPESKKPICALPGMKQLSCRSALGSHITTQEQPGLQDLCPCARSWHKEESGASWEGISEYFCTAWTSKKGPRICTVPQVVLGKFTAACCTHGVGVG